MKLSYYPGCSLEGTSLDYDQSVRKICKKLDIELVDIPDWNCCGASSAHMTSHQVGIRLPMRNLRQAEGLGHDILVPCAACFQRLRAADREMRDNPEAWDTSGYGAESEIIHISSFLARPEILEKIREKITHPLNDLPLACYYGCLSLRHPHITGAPQWEMPVNLERIVEATGAKPVNWSHRTECCSGSLTMARPDIARKLVGDITAAARRGGAVGMVTDCPMCQANVESRQTNNPGDAGLPVFFATELIVAAIEGKYPKKQQKVHLVSPAVMTRHFESAAAEDSV